MPYYETAKYQSVALEYQTGQRMRVVLPALGVAPEDLDEDPFTHQNFREQIVALQIPRYHLQSRHDLGSTLKTLMPQAFSGGADFTGISPSPLQLGSAIQRVEVEVDESGTVATAATVVGTMIGCSMNQGMPKILMVDRPFIFSIEDPGTNTLLFVGRVTHP